MTRSSEDYSEEIGLDQLAREGYGKDFMRSMTELGAARARARYKQTMQQGEALFARRGFQFSGIDEIKVPAMALGQFAQDIMSSENEAFAENEQIKLQYRSMLFDQLRHSENMRLQRDANRRDALDYIGAVGSVVSLI